MHHVGPLKGLSSARNTCEYEQGFLPKAPSLGEIERYLAKASQVAARACGVKRTLEGMFPNYCFRKSRASTEENS